MTKLVKNSHNVVIIQFLVGLLLIESSKNINIAGQIDWISFTFGLVGFSAVVNAVIEYFKLNNSSKE